MTGIESTELDTRSDDHLAAVIDLHAARRTTRRRRWVAAIAGGAVAAAVGVVLILTSVFSQPAPSPSVASVAIDRIFPNTGANIIRVQVTNQQAISDIAVFCEIIDPGSGYQTGQMALWARAADGSESKIISWPMKVGSTQYRAAAPIPSGDITVLELRDSAGGVLSSMPV